MIKEKLFCYLRVSTKSQEEEGSSIENQRHIGQTLCDKLGMEYVELNEGGFTSMVRSEEHLIKSPRPKFEELKQGIKIGRITNVWYYSRSRYCRDEIEDGLTRRFYFQKYKVNVLEGVNGEPRKFGTSQERFMDSMFTTIQEFDKDQRREVSISGKRHKSRKDGKLGVFMGGTINFGFENVDKRWEIHKEESKWVKRIFQMYLQNHSLKEIKELLDSRGVVPRRSKVWNIGTLLTMLKNRVYVGEYLWKDKDTGEEFLITIPKIISHSLFNRVQKQINKNQKNKGDNVRKYDTLLSDFLICSCGERITGQIKMTHNTGVKKYYYCHSKENKWKGKKVEICMNRRSLNMDKTDTLVTEKVKEIIGNSSVLKERFKEDVLSKKSLSEKKIKEEKTKLEKQIDNLNKEIESLINSISSNEINHLTKQTRTDIYRRIKEGLEEQLSIEEDNKKSKIKEIDDLDNQKDWIDWVTKYSKDISKQFNNVTTDLLGGVVEEILITPTLGKNRDDKEVQIGHRFDLKFKLPIVNDSVKYNDSNNKSSGYDVVNGVKSSKGELIPLDKGGRPKKKQDQTNG